MRAGHPSTAPAATGRTRCSGRRQHRQSRRCTAVSASVERALTKKFCNKSLSFFSSPQVLSARKTAFVSSSTFCPSVPIRAVFELSPPPVLSVSESSTSCSSFDNCSWELLSASAVSTRSVFHARQLASLQRSGNLGNLDPLLLARDGVGDLRARGGVDERRSFGSRHDGRLGLVNWGRFCGVVGRWFLCRSV